MDSYLIDPCNLCKDNHRFCIIKKNGINPKDCPCRVCDIKSICSETCDEHYALRYVYKGKNNGQI